MARFVSVGVDKIIFFEGEEDGDGLGQFLLLTLRRYCHQINAVAKIRLKN